MARTSLQDYYDSRVQGLRDDDLLTQVAHTLGGRPMPPDTIDRMIADLDAALDLRPGVRFLDLCCGNGALTARLAARAGATVGVDFSKELIRVANAHSAATGAVYLQGDVSRLDRIAGLRGQVFDRVLICAGLQHFPPRAFDGLLDGILARCAPGAAIVLAYVPEAGKQRAFFDTPRRRLKRAWLKLTGRDIFGWWWDRRTIAAAADRRGLDCAFPALDPETPYAGYRFTARLAVPPDPDRDSAPR